MLSRLQIFGNRWIEKHSIFSMVFQATCCLKQQYLFSQCSFMMSRTIISFSVQLRLTQVSKLQADKLDILCARTQIPYLERKQWPPPPLWGIIAWSQSNIWAICSVCHHTFMLIAVALGLASIKIVRMVFSYGNTFQAHWLLNLLTPPHPTPHLTRHPYLFNTWKYTCSIRIYAFVILTPS